MGNLAPMVRALRESQCARREMVPHGVPKDDMTKSSYSHFLWKIWSNLPPLSSYPGQRYGLLCRLRPLIQNTLNQEEQIKTGIDISLLL
ncbi:hypothetical protein V6N11_006306 [Hibiscus sabdariffa]|uniref:Uncharacterized protein n=1 Tax=Hibiscus sabdariffa TaxID=183260 RepID=A0ABR2RR00_9ROSI